MQKSNEIKRLPQELINQIAAGEVIERPASVVKELVDNSIDAGATKITVKLKAGGIDLIEVSDNGVGIPEDMLVKAFEAHSTSKISSIEELNDLLTMGFRGEALSTIVSVAKVSALSKYKESDKAFFVKFNGIDAESVKPQARDNGTTIRVEELFYNIPARRKFLKTAETEYRKVLAILSPYFLAYPHIHFVLEKDGKEVLNLPVEQPSKVSSNRFNKISKVLPEDLVTVSYDGAGMKVEGFIGHPKVQQNKVTHLYVFLNDRPISDRAIIRSVMEGSRGFIPHTARLPFALSINVPAEQVDVNVHPRKEEVRFANPYRVYSAIEQAIRDSLQKALSASNNQKDYLSEDSNSFASSLNNNEIFDSPNVSFKRSDSGRLKEISFKPRSERFNIGQAVEFSRNVLQGDSQGSLPFESSAGMEPRTGSPNQSALNENFTTSAQYFKKYLFLERADQLWVVDQHAAAERITFERLQNNYKTSAQNIQNLLVPLEFSLSLEEASFLSEHIVFFQKIGFSLSVNGEVVTVNAVPAEFAAGDIEGIFKSIFEVSDNIADLDRDFEKQKDKVLASMACHRSIRTNQRLTPQEGISLVNQLLECNNPYSCPHGRPIVWKLTLDEIDTKFFRTY